jgi:hypothetical protein
VGQFACQFRGNIADAGSKKIEPDRIRTRFISRDYICPPPDATNLDSKH